MKGRKMSEKARELMDQYAGDWELVARAVQNVGKGRFETYYLVLDRQRRKRWTPLSGSDVKNAFWVLSSAVVIGNSSRGRPDAEIHAIVDSAVDGITLNDQNLFAACALNFVGNRIRLHAETPICYLAHTEAWQWHLGICARLDLAIAQRASWKTLWKDPRQSRAAQLRQTFRLDSIEADDSDRARIPSSLSSAHQALLGKAFVMQGPEHESPFECFYLILRKSSERGEWVSESYVDDYFLFAYTMLGAHYTGCSVVPPRGDETLYIGFLTDRVTSIDRSVYRTSLIALVKASTAIVGCGLESAQDSDWDDSDVTDRENQPALGLVYSSSGPSDPDLPA